MGVLLVCGREGGWLGGKWFAGREGGRLVDSLGRRGYPGVWQPAGALSSS